MSPQEIGDGKIEVMTIKALAMYTKVCILNTDTTSYMTHLSTFSM